MKKSHQEYLKEAVAVSWESRENGNTPFGALLVSPEGEILLKQGNIEISTGECTGHAETALMAKASKAYSKDYLKDCTFYTTFEPCAMCSGAIYWGGVGTVVFGATEEKLLELTGDNPQNPTMSLSCREVFARGQKDITVIGPFQEMEEEILAPHLDYWK